MQTVVRYSLDMPKTLLDKVRSLSTQRKIENHAIRTQKAIIIEFLERGLLLADDELPTPKPPHTV